MIRKIMIRRKKKTPEEEYEGEQKAKIEQIRRMRAGSGTTYQTYVSSSGGGGG